MSTRTALTIILSLVTAVVFIAGLAIGGLIYALMQARSINFPVLPRSSAALPHTPATQESLALHLCASPIGVPAWRVSSFPISASHDAATIPARRSPSLEDGRRVSSFTGESNTARRIAHAAGELQFPSTTFAGEPPASAGPVSPRAAVRMFPPRVAGGSSDLSALNSQLSTLRS